MKKVSIQIPCYNEADGLPMLYDALCGQKGICETLKEYEFEFIFVNDGSIDNTLDIIKLYAEKDTRIKYISLSRNFGKECAMLSGFDYASGDCMVIMDADLQDPPLLIKEMLKYWEQGYDDVYAKRMSRGKESWLRKRFSLAYYSLLQKTSRFDILENVGDFRLLDRKCINALRELREKERYTKGMFAWIGFKKKEILFERGNREKGKSSWRFKDLLNLGIDGEYLGRIFNEAKGRPVYIVGETNIEK